MRKPESESLSLCIIGAITTSSRESALLYDHNARHGGRHARREPICTAWPSTRAGAHTRPQATQRVRILGRSGSVSWP